MSKKNKTKEDILIPKEWYDGLVEIVKRIDGEVDNDWVTYLRGYVLSLKRTFHDK